jgi:hypothetical protein
MPDHPCSGVGQEPGAVELFAALIKLISMISHTESGNALGVVLPPEGARRQSLKSVVDLIFAEDLAGRILPFDSAAARRSGRAHRRHRPVTRRRPVDRDHVRWASLRKSGEVEGAIYLGTSVPVPPMRRWPTRSSIISIWICWISSRCSH